MFNKDFYPTPENVITQMLMGIDVQGKHILEPSAGSGNIVDVLNGRGADQVLTFEKEQVLADHVMEKSTFLGHDFFDCTAEQISHVDCIIMNPPFSQDERHILHAWEIAPEGCRIVSLCPTVTIKDSSVYRHRKQLGTLVKNYGDASIELGDCFSTAERKTNVDVSIVNLFKPVQSKDFDYEGFYLDGPEEGEYPDGLIRYSEVRSIVSRYVNAVKSFDKVEEAARELEDLTNPIGRYNRNKFEFKLNHGKAVTTKAEFSKEFQKECWRDIFTKMNLNKFVTSGVMEDINRFVETQSKYPFTMKNIYRMMEIIIGTREQTMERALVEAFDNITKHHHDNRYHVEGWKTNSHYLIGKKFILPWMVEQGFSGQMGFRYTHRNNDRLTDLHKALCFLTGSQPTDPERVDKDGNAEKIQDLRSWGYHRGLEFHQWYDWGFFEIKGFKKGTLHCKFKDEKVWELFNRRVAKIKGYPLPEVV